MANYDKYNNPPQVSVHIISALDVMKAVMVDGELWINKQTYDAYGPVFIRRVLKKPNLKINTIDWSRNIRNQNGPTNR